MNSDDDERSIDWAPTRIKKLEEETGRLNHRITEAMERITGETCRFNRLREMHHDLVKQSADEIGALTDRVNELQGAIASRVREELSAGFRDLEPEPEFSTPIGRRIEEKRQEVDRILGRAGDTEDRTHLRGTGTPARHGGLFALGGVVPPILDEMHPTPEKGFHRGSMAAVFEASWERGYEAGRRAAIDEAESRIGDVLDRSNILNPATRSKIIEAITAVLSTKTGNRRLDLGEPQYAGHLYRSGCCNRPPVEHIGLHRDYLAEIAKDAPQA